MKRKYKSNIYDFSRRFKMSRKDQAYWEINCFTPRRLMKVKAFLLTYDWWVE